MSENALKFRKMEINFCSVNILIFFACELLARVRLVY